MENKVNENYLKKKKTNLKPAMLSFRVFFGYNMNALGIQNSKFLSWGTTQINHIYKENY